MLPRRFAVGVFLDDVATAECLADGRFAGRTARLEWIGTAGHQPLAVVDELAQDGVDVVPIEFSLDGVEQIERDVPDVAHVDRTPVGERDVAAFRSSLAGSISLHRASSGHRV